MMQTEIITCKCALMPKDPCEVGTTKFFLSEIFSDVSTQAGPAGNLALHCGMASSSASSSSVWL